MTVPRDGSERRREAEPRDGGPLGGGDPIGQPPDEGDSGERDEVLLRSSGEQEPVRADVGQLSRQGLPVDEGEADGPVLGPEAIGERDTGPLGARELRHELGLLGAQVGLELTRQVREQVVPPHRATVGHRHGSRPELAAPARRCAPLRRPDGARTCTAAGQVLRWRDGVGDLAPDP
ncbi:hypothetical protein [Actinotalea sp.]|uniref:hypothetical protein n=1 Tax=Actinotalea sp. TaxID=1872145 RepID=UPI00356872B9